MIKYLLALALLCQGVKAATGDILSAVIETNWVLETKIEGYGGTGTNGAFNAGFGANNTGTPKVVLTMDTPGFNSLGVLVTNQRVVYGTKVLRMTYPNHTRSNIWTEGSDMWVNQALSDHVYANDLNVTASYGSGWYSNSLAGNVSPTNLSTLQWPKPFAAWTMVPFQSVSNGFWATLIAAHRSADNFLPVQAVRVRMADQHGNTFTNWARWYATPEPLTTPLGVMTTELKAWMDCSTFTQGDVITVNADVYPRYGTNWKSSDDGICLTQAEGFSPITLFCDNAGTFSTRVAVVDLSGTTDAGAVVTNTSVLSSGISLAACFTNIANAAARLAATNNVVHGHNDTSGGLIVIRAPSPPQATTWVGGSTTYGTNGRTWTTITIWPTNRLGDVVINGQSGNSRLVSSGKIKVDSLVWTNTGGGGMLSGIGEMWFTNCHFRYAGSAFWNGVTNIYLTGNYIRSGGQGLTPFGATCNQFILVRGNDFTGWTRQVNPWNFLGNYKGGSTQPVSRFFDWSRISNGGGIPTNCFTWCNYLGGFSNVNSFSLASTPLGTNMTGFVFAQNVCEIQSIATLSTVFNIAGDSSVMDQHNVIVWHNTFLGERTSVAYNDLGTSPYYRWNWSFKNNVADSLNTKSDTFNSASGPQGARDGNWSALYGCGWAGNSSMQRTNTGAVTVSFSFGWEFMGLNSFQPPTVNSTGLPVGTPTVASFPRFVNDASVAGTGLGGGDYRFREISPCNLQTDGILPYDLAGRRRTPANNAPGAYAGGLITYIIESGHKDYIAEPNKSYVQP